MVAPQRNAVFLDRDGTIIEDKDFLDDPDKIELIPGAAEALKKLLESGFLLVVISNQSGVARGYFTEEKCVQINEEFVRRFSEHGVELAAPVYYCPHLPDAPVKEYAMNCSCRKPRPALFERAAMEHGIDLGKSWAVGDSMRDIEPAKKLGAHTILVLTGKGSSQAELPESEKWADFKAADIAEAADIILRNESGRSVV